MLQIKNYILGPFQNNTYLLSETNTHECIIIDPAIGSRILAIEIANVHLELSQIWITHAHFDHVGGIHEIEDPFSYAIPVFIHPLEIPLWKDGGGSKGLGFDIDLDPFPPIRSLADCMAMKMGEYSFQALHTPGHTPGHIAFYCSKQNMMFCGDLIFKNSIGRTDLKGGNQGQIIKSIREKILSLPDETRLLCGHGPETTVGNERKENPFLE